LEFVVWSWEFVFPAPLLIEGQSYNNLPQQNDR